MQPELTTTELELLANIHTGVNLIPRRSDIRFLWIQSNLLVTVLCATDSGES